MSNMLAYKAVASSVDICRFAMPFDDEKRLFAEGRVLVVVMPATQFERGPFALLPPTKIEERQLHKLGMHLLNAAFDGKRLTTEVDPIAHIWAHPNPYQKLGKAPLEIAIPTVFTLRKLSSGHWMPGRFTNYIGAEGASQVVEHSPKKDLQEAADWFFRIINLDPISLAHVPAIEKMKQFPNTGTLRRRLTATAKRRRKHELDYALEDIAYHRGMNARRYGRGLNA